MVLPVFIVPSIFVLPSVKVFPRSKLPVFGVCTGVGLSCTGVGLSCTGGLLLNVYPAPKASCLFFAVSKSVTDSPFALYAVKSPIDGELPVFGVCSVLVDIGWLVSTGAGVTDSPDRLLFSDVSDLLLGDVVAA